MKLERNTLLTDEDGMAFYVYNTVKYQNKDFAVCVEYENPKKYAVFEYKYDVNDLLIKKEENEKDIQIILAYSLKKRDNK